MGWWVVGGPHFHMSLINVVTSVVQGFCKQTEGGLNQLAEMEEGFKKEVTYFGERNADDLGSFFSDWDKFTQAFQVRL